MKKFYGAIKKEKGEYGIGIVSGTGSSSARIFRLSKIGDHQISTCNLPKGTEQEMEQELMRLLNNPKFCEDYGIGAWR